MIFELAMMYGILVGRVQVGPYSFQEKYLFEGKIYTIVIDTE